MTTFAHGAFYVDRDRAIGPAVTTRYNDKGDFVISLRVVDNQGPRAKEFFVVHWSGKRAQAFHATRPHLKAGDPLRLVLKNPRALPGLRVPEIHAMVISCKQLPGRHPATA